MEKATHAIDQKHGIPTVMVGNRLSLVWEF
jgi:hypothetical protein